MPTLDFRGRSLIQRHHESLPHHALVPDTALSVVPAGGNPSLTDNLVIEGDNLLALRSLMPLYQGKVKCVYIDPPYNTGNEHWVYNDNASGALFKEWIGIEVGPQGEDYNRHDKWCCMMYPRLHLLHDMLRNDGVIFVSIDDNEVQHLRMLMDEVFGEENFLASVVWQKKYAPANDTTDFSWTHDYLLVYAKQRHFEATGKPLAAIGRKERTEEQKKLYKNPDSDPRGLWRTDNYLSNKTPKERPNLYYAIQHPTTGEDIWPREGLTWRYSKEKHARNVKEDRIWWGASKENRVPAYKRLLSEVRDIVAATWWPHTQYGHNDEARKELKALLGALADGTTPKPTRLIREILKLTTSPDAEEEEIVLDSFAGTGTTAQAVLQLNNEDGGNRRFILVQMASDSKDDERAGKNIARDITRERVKRVIEGSADAPPGGSFTYCTLSEEPLKGYYGVIRPDTPWNELAGYIWHSENLPAFDPAQADSKTGRVGLAGDLAIYLLYTPDADESRVFDSKTLESLTTDPARTILVYCEKTWMDADILRAWNHDHKKSVQVRLLPAQLR